jgi:hypothetical protein
MLNPGSTSETVSERGEFRRFLRVVRSRAVEVLLGLAGLLLVSGCGSKELSTPGGPGVYEYTVSIAAPIDSVWRYVGNSANAREWSVYFHHITPLDTSRTGVPLPPDGTIGSVRVCYRRADETGPTWDEVVTGLDSTGTERHRRIRTYRLRGFGGMQGWLARRTEYSVTQIYQERGDSTALTFRTQLLRPDNDVMRWAFAREADEVVRVFRLNLENIKAALEARQHGARYVRLHPYLIEHALN